MSHWLRRSCPCFPLTCHLVKSQSCLAWGMMYAWNALLPIVSSHVSTPSRWHGASFKPLVVSKFSRRYSTCGLSVLALLTIEVLLKQTLKEL